MYDEVCYKKPFLKEVICRLDFGARVERFLKSLPQKLATAALREFPISEPQKAQTQEFMVSATGFQTKSEETIQWTYHGKNREKTLVISPEAMIVTNRKYKDFEAFHNDVDNVVDSLFDAEKELSVARLGLRYVNVIELDNGDPLTWAEYVNEQMLGIIDTHKDQGALSRVFHIVEFNYDTVHVKFQFGMPNPDYPALIKRKQFVLDIDAYVQGALTQQDVEESIEVAHEKIQELFESSITDRTRDLMQPVMT